MFAPGVSSTEVLGYRLFINQVNSYAVPSIEIYDGSSVSNVLKATAFGLESAQNYWFAYKVLNRAGWSELSPVLKLIAGKLPQPPSQSPFQISTSPILVKIGWAPTLDVGGAAKLDQYFIYSSEVQVDTVNSDTLEFTFTGVTAGQAYSMSVSAVSAIGEGPRSNPVQVWAVDLPAAPTLSLVDTNRSSCSVAWTAVTPPANTLITGYRLYVDDGLDGDFVLAYDGKDKPSAFTRSVEGLEPRLIYRLKVAAMNKAGEGVQSTAITCYTVTIPGQPGTPVLISSTSSSIRVRWAPAFDDGGSPIQSYILEMDEVEGIGYANV